MEQFRNKRCPPRVTVPTMQRNCPSILHSYDVPCPTPSAAVQAILSCHIFRKTQSVGKWSLVQVGACNLPDKQEPQASSIFRLVHTKTIESNTHPTNWLWCVYMAQLFRRSAYLWNGMWPSPVRFAHSADCFTGFWRPSRIQWTLAARAIGPDTISAICMCPRFHRNPHVDVRPILFPSVPALLCVGVISGARTYFRALGLHTCAEPWLAGCRMCLA